MSSSVRIWAFGLLLLALATWAETATAKATTYQGASRHGSFVGRYVDGAFKSATFTTVQGKRFVLVSKSRQGRWLFSSAKAKHFVRLGCKFERTKLKCIGGGIIETKSGLQRASFRFVATRR